MLPAGLKNYDFKINGEVIGGAVFLKNSGRYEVHFNDAKLRSYLENIPLGVGNAYDMISGVVEVAGQRGVYVNEFKKIVKALMAGAHRGGLTLTAVENVNPFSGVSTEEHPVTSMTQLERLIRQYQATAGTFNVNGAPVATFEYGRTGYQVNFTNPNDFLSGQESPFSNYPYWVASKGYGMERGTFKDFMSQFLNDVGGPLTVQFTE